MLATIKYRFSRQLNIGVAASCFLLLSLATAGTIEPGKHATLVLLNSNPLEDIAHSYTEITPRITLQGDVFYSDSPYI